LDVAAVLALLAAIAGIIFIGVRFLVAPELASADFGVALNGGNGVAFAYTKGIRDIFSGLVALPFLLMGQRRAVAWIFLIATIVPVADGFITINSHGIEARDLAVQWGTALFLLVMSWLLFRPFRSHE